MKHTNLLLQSVSNAARTLGLTALLGLLALGNAAFIFGQLGPLMVVMQLGLVLYALYARTAAPLVRNARELDYVSNPWLGSLMRRLSEQAGLHRVPRIYLTPGQVPNAAAILSGSSPRIVMTTALADSMDQSQLAGVLAHEVAHIRNRDLLILGLSGALHELVVFTGQLGLLFMLLMPWPFLTGRSGAGFLSLAILLVSPLLTTLVYTALMRTREFAADLGAAELLGSPRPLASALAQLDRQERSWQWNLFPYRPSRDPGVFRTHPDNTERIQRLLALDPARPVLHAGWQPGAIRTGMMVKNALY
jgi:heat shock protein HtpX